MEDRRRPGPLGKYCRDRHDSLAIHCGLGAGPATLLGLSNLVLELRFRETAPLARVLVRRWPGRDGVSGIGLAWDGGDR